MEHQRPLQRVPDNELLHNLAALIKTSRRVESELVAHIGEVDERRLYAREACPSMFAYCTGILHLSEAEAFLRITAARLSRQYPLVLEMLGDGRLHLSGIAKLAAHLTPDNAADLLARSAGRSKRQIEELLAAVFPKPAVPAMIRRLPTAVSPSDQHSSAGGAASPLGQAPLTTAATHTPVQPNRLADTAAVLVAPAVSGGTRAQLRPDRVAPTKPAPIEPIGPARYKVQFAASAEFRAKLERLQALRPGRDLAAVLEEAVTEKIGRIEARRFAKTKAPRTEARSADGSPVARYIPAAVRRAVYERDQGRCRFVDKSGTRCIERHQLEFHHRHPFRMGGNHDRDNLRLMCRAHNQYLAERDYGPRTRRPSQAARPTPAP